MQLKLTMSCEPSTTIMNVALIVNSYSKMQKLMNKWNEKLEITTNKIKITVINKIHQNSDRPQKTRVQRISNIGEEQGKK